MRVTISNIDRQPHGDEEAPPEGEESRHDGRGRAEHIGVQVDLLRVTHAQYCQMQNSCQHQEFINCVLEKLGNEIAFKT